MPDDQRRGCPDVRHTVLQTHRKNSPFCILLLDIQTSCHCYSHAPSVPTWPPAVSLPWLGVVLYRGLWLAEGH
jgi:hypothetical protein